jgi:hypothetical protein
MSNEKKYKGIAYIQRDSSSSKRNIYVDKYQRMHRKGFISLAISIQLYHHVVSDVYLFHPNNFSVSRNKLICSRIYQ